MDVLGDVFLLRRFAIGARPSIAFLLRRFAIGACSAMRFCCDALPLAYVQRCVSVAALCPHARSAMRFCCGALPLAHVQRCGSVAALCHWRMFSDAALAGHLPSVHACCLTHCDKQDGLRYASFLFRRVEIAICVFSMRRRGYLPLWVHFGLVRFFVAISTGYRETRDAGNGAAARPLRIFARAHWP